MRYIFFFLLAFTSTLSKAQNYSKKTSASLSGFYSDNEFLPYWFYTNQNGRLDTDTNILALLSYESSFKLKDNARLKLGIGALYQEGTNGDFQIDQLFVRFRNSWLKATSGAWHEPQEFDGLSSTNGNILWSSNTRAIPGILLEASNPIKVFKGLSLDWGIGHYELGNDRFTQRALIHYKRIGAFVKLNKKSGLHLELQHYVQWAGESEELGKAPDGFSDFLDVFFAKNAGSEDALPGEQINSLGNHLGSYNINYKYSFDNRELQLYYQHLFEDGSGTAFKNFPDGIWGAYYKRRDNFWLKSLLYEFVYTLDQSGATGRSGVDNYFSNSIYQTGWLYKNRVIGIPFITPRTIKNGSGNNRIRAHHFGVTARYKKIKGLFKGSYVEGLGTYSEPIKPKLKSLYTYGSLTYTTENYGEISLYSGYDILNTDENNFGIGLSYNYLFK